MIGHSSKLTPLIAQSKIGKSAPAARKTDPVEEYRTYLFIGWPVAVVLILLVIWFARVKWLRIRPQVNAPPAGSPERVKPGHAAEHLDPARWADVFGRALKRAEAALAADPSPVAARTADALRATGPMQAALAEATRAAAWAAVTTGELETRLVADGRTAVYALVFPDKHAHARLICRHPALADGWLDHAARVRAGLAADGAAPDLLCLLFFLGPDARDGTLAVAYEADDGRLAAAELVGSEPAADRPVQRTGTWGFQLARGADDGTAA
jgi:hypothetical protein